MPHLVADNGMEKERNEDKIKGRSNGFNRDEQRNFFYD